MKKKNEEQHYREVAQDLDALIDAMESLVANYHGMNCTFAEALGQKGLSHEFDQGGRFHPMAEQFKAHVGMFDNMLNELKATQAEYQVLQLLEPTHLN